MSDSEPLLHELGTYDPNDAKKVLTALEAAAISFEVESDHSALMRPERTMLMNFGMYPDGSKLRVFVPEPMLAAAESIVAKLFPV